ncbi:MAG: hypothetical protein MSJ87_01940 [Firmicutes bacterium]|nr:hypothetical protein [Bacillota bacterium]
MKDENKIKDIKELFGKALREYGSYISAREKNGDILDKLHTERIKAGGLGYLNLRDALNEIGHILKDDPKTGTFVAIIRNGSHDLNSAFAVCMLEDDHIDICAYAKEGIIKQHLAEKAIKQLKASLDRQKSSILKQMF